MRRVQFVVAPSTSTGKSTTSVSPASASWDAYKKSCRAMALVVVTSLPAALTSRIQYSFLIGSVSVGAYDRSKGVAIPRMTSILPERGTRMSAERATWFAENGGQIRDRLREQYAESRTGERSGSYRVADPRSTMRDDNVATSQFVLDRCAFDGDVLMSFTSPLLTLGGATGVCRWSTREEQGDATRSAYLILPGVETTARFQDSVGSSISFFPDALHRTAQRMHADDRLRPSFTRGRPSSPADGRRLREVVQFLVAERGAALASELVAATLYRHAAAIVLNLFPQRQDPATRPASVQALQAGYRRAVRYIDDYASLPLTLEDIAEAAGLPTAQLDAAFRWHSPSGGSASEYLRGVRLSAARHDLLSGVRDGTDTVQAVAHRWGFLPSAFTRAYRVRYGESPARTLPGPGHPSLE